MKIIECVQNSTEWFAARCGIPSASNFDKIVTTTGNVATQRKKYLYQLAGERITGKREETYQNAAMLRGIEMEVEARGLYELITGTTVEQVGFCIADGNAIYGASPDGLVDDDGLLEIKCPLIATHVSYLSDGGLPSEYVPQVQGQLLVTGRKWVDFMSYFPGMKPLLVRVEPDGRFQSVLGVALIAFCLDLDNLVEKIR